MSFILAEESLLRTGHLFHAVLSFLSWQPRQGSSHDSELSHSGSHQCDKNFSKSRHSWHLTEYTKFMQAIIQRCVTSCPGGDQRLQGQVGIKFIKKRMGACSVNSLANDQSFVPSTFLGRSQLHVTAASWGSDTLFWLPWAPINMWHTVTQTWT